MTDAVAVALIVAGSSILQTVFNWFTTRKPIKDLAHNTNTLKDELVAATEKGAFAAGVKSQKDNPT